MKNLEARTVSKQIWWDGQQGGVSKGSDARMLLRRPVIPFLPTPWTQFNCTVELGVNPANYYTQINTEIPLDDAEVSAFEDMIDAMFPEAGTGGGGGGGGGGGSTGEAEVAHRVRVFGMSGKEGANAQVINFPADALNKTYVIALGGFEGSISNVARNTVENYFTLPIMVNAYVTYNGFITSSAKITWADETTHVRFKVEVFTRRSGTAWPAAPASSEIVKLGEGDNKNVQFYTKQWIDANMLGPQDVQMRITPIYAPAGFDMTSVTFGKVGWGTTYSLSSCAAKNPDLVAF